LRVNHFKKKRNVMILKEDSYTTSGGPIDVEDHANNEDPCFEVEACYVPKLICMTMDNYVNYVVDE